MHAHVKSYQAWLGQTAPGYTIEACKAIMGSWQNKAATHHTNLYPKTSFYLFLCAHLCGNHKHISTIHINYRRVFIFFAGSYYKQNSHKPSSVPSGANRHLSVMSSAEKRSNPGGQEDIKSSPPNHTSPESRGVGGVLSCLWQNVTCSGGLEVTTDRRSAAFPARKHWNRHPCKSCYSK